MREWVKTTLGQVAEIRVSNVDKKIMPGERKVRLCNYMDVYSSTAVSGSHALMEASATSAEIQRFRLLGGDVVITKDSESPDDIAVPAYVTPDIGEDVVCGYHLAILRPRAGLDGRFLSHLLRLPEVNRHFSRHATGSTRYGLGLQAVHDAPLRIPASEFEQRQIAEVLSTLDDEISRTALLVEKLKLQKQGLMRDLLTGKTRLDCCDDGLPLNDLQVENK